MEKLRIYQKALELIQKIYQLIRENEQFKKDFSLNDQLKRASVSVALNIAEGYGRGSKFFKNYLRIAVGSTNETIAALQIVHVVYKIDTNNLQKEYLILAKQISSFSKSFT